MRRHSFSCPITRVPQRFVWTAIHHDYVDGEWIFVSIRFSKRLLLLDESRDAFLRTLVYLGGYCTVEQAQKLELANSPTRVAAQLQALASDDHVRLMVLRGAGRHFCTGADLSARSGEATAPASKQPTTSLREVLAALERNKEIDEGVFSAGRTLFSGYRNGLFRSFGTSFPKRKMFAVVNIWLCD